MCSRYSRKTHCPTLEKSGLQNIGTCEKQVKQCELSDHWTPIKKLLLKKTTGDDTKKDKKFDWNTSFDKRF